MTEHEPASPILCALAGGETIDDLLRGYPDVSRDDIAAVLAATPHARRVTAARPARGVLAGDASR